MKQEYAEQIRDVLSRVSGGIPYTTAPLPIAGVELVIAQKKLLEVTA